MVYHKGLAWALFFSSFILEDSLQFSQASIYADDTSLTIASSNPVKLIEDAHQELLNISEWMRVNKPSPNPNRTEFMVIGHPFKTRNLNLPQVLTLDGSDIKKLIKQNP